MGFEAFQNFPSKWGLSAEKLERADWSNCGANHATALLQSWLFFGVLTEVFGGAGIPFNMEDFRRQNHCGSWVVSTKFLQRYIWYWVAAYHHSDLEGKRQHAYLVDSCLKLSNTIFIAIITEHLTFFTNCRPEKPINLILLSIAILGEVLSYAKRKVYSTTTTLALHWPFPGLVHALLDAGWCVGDITNMTRDCDSSTLLYLSTLDQHEFGKDHKRCNPQEGCQAYQVDWHSYVTKHLEGCSKNECEDVGPSMEEIGLILRDGDIPLIAMDLSQTPSQMEIVRYQEQSVYRNDYVAISHVWSDGLGNPQANCLPRCQLNRIQGLVNSLDPEEAYLIPFWIDTLCVPLAPEIKNLAIINMDKTYRNAEDVLVLDNSWKGVTNEMSAVELMMRIRYSTWMTRLWTFQEARLSRHLWFQLQDGPLSINDVGDSFKHGRNLPKVSKMLLQEDNYELLVHPSKMQLGRALAYESLKVQESLERYAALPRQENEEEEEARIAAIRILSEHHEEYQVRKTWQRIIEQLNPGNPLSELDSDVQARLQNMNFFNTVASHAMGTKLLMQGIGAEHTIGKIGPHAVKPGHRPAEQLIDVVRGLRGRTTSRLEDEIICLSVLLGLDVSRVTDIPVLHWRWKLLLTAFTDFLLFLKALIRHRPLFVVLANLVARLLRYAHEERLKVFLSQIEFFPKAMIFWNTPRLQRTGWRWAPFSFLRKDLDVGLFKGGPRGYLTDHGLLVKTRAIRLRNSPYFPHKSDSTLGQSDDYEYLHIQWADAEVDNVPRWAIVWQWARLHIAITWPPQISANRQRAMDDRISDGLAILLDEKKGALVSIFKVHSNAIYAKHIMTLEAVTNIPKQPILRASGQWVSEGMWCIA